MLVYLDIVVQCILFGLNSRLDTVNEVQGKTIRDQIQPTNKTTPEVTVVLC